jgi:enoyl-CoA hydratase
MAFENLILEEKDGVATITFNRPKALNAINHSLLIEFATILDQMADSESIRALILTGAGEKAFVAGADINEVAKLTPLSAKRFAQHGKGILDKLQKLPIPVIAAVNGFALGGGCEIVLACDLIIAAESAKFGLPEMNIGVIPGFGGTQRLPRLVGLNKAKELIFTGKMLTATEAAAIGLVNTVVPDADLMSEVQALANSFTKKGRVALRAAKEVLNNGVNVDLVMACKMETDAFSLCIASSDAREGTQAFLEKRKPKFTGSLES